LIRKNKLKYIDIGGREKNVLGVISISDV